MEILLISCLSLSISVVFLVMAYFSLKGERDNYKKDCAFLEQQYSILSKSNAKLKTEYWEVCSNQEKEFKDKYGKMLEDILIVLNTRHYDGSHPSTSCEMAEKIIANKHKYIPEYWR